jgi:hypothetical protein
LKIIDAKSIRHEFYSAVDSPQRWQRLGHLLQEVKFIPAEVLYEAFFGVFLDPSRPDSRFEDQEAAGGMLWKLKPHCHIDLPQAIMAVLPTYDLSIEELPWYYAEIFGKEIVYSTAKTLLSQEHNKQGQETLKTFLFWLGAKPDVMKHSLKNKWKKIKG